MENHCVDCGKKITQYAKRCKSCAQIGKHHSEESKEKMSEAKKGKEFTEEHKVNLSDSMKGKESPMKGKHHSKEGKRKISEAHISLRDSEFDSTHKFFDGQAYLIHQGRWWRTNHPHISLSWDIWNYYHPEDQIKEKDGCVIHHKNKDPSDDRIENLQKMMRGEHISLHKSKGNNIK